MSGIDLQMLSFYPCERKTLHWYKKLVIHTIQLLLPNAHKFYNRYSGSRMPPYDYCQSVIDVLHHENQHQLFIFHKISHLAVT